uniref:Uncharacterized protein n=1 Tax=Anopheles farauti TaxID=69004 RepID=A0A182Q2M6_9DIPT
MPKTAPKSSDRPGGTCRTSTGGRKRKLPSVEPTPSHPVDHHSSTKRIVGAGRVAHHTSPPRPNQPTSTASDASTPNGRGAVTDFMLQALGRIRELQDELDFLQNDPYAEDTDDDDDDDDADEAGRAGADVIGGREAEAIGWAVCARETMHFLQREGIPPDSPLMVNLRRRLIGQPPPDVRSTL